MKNRIISILLAVFIMIPGGIYASAGETAEFPVLNNIVYEDFGTTADDDWQTGIQTEAQVKNGGTAYSFVEGDYEIVTYGENKAMRLRRTGATNGYPLWRVSVTPDNFKGYETIVLEYKLKPVISGDAYIRARAGQSYGTWLPGLYKGNVKAQVISGDTVGTYTSGEWITLTNVLYIDSYNVAGTDSDGNATETRTLKRDIYVDGEYKYTAEEAYASGYQNFADAEGKLYFNFNIAGAPVTSAADNSGYVDIDYFRVYTEATEFAVKGAEAVPATTGDITLTLSNHPDHNSVLSAIEVQDAGGNKVCGIESATLIPEQSKTNEVNYSLKFDETLKPLSDYKLVITNLSDNSGKSYSGEISFTTPEGEYPETEYIWNDDFSGESIDTSYISAYNTTTLINDGTTVDSRYSLTEEDTLKFGAYAKGTYFIKDVTSVANKPKLVLSYSVKPNSTEDVNGTRRQYGLSTVYMSKGIIYDNENGNSIGTYNSGEWLDITCVYDNAANTRDIYINGEYKTTAECDTLDAWKYSLKGRAYFCFYHYGYARNTFTELDNLEIYALPEGLRYDIAEASVEDVSLKFNISPDAATVIPANFTVLDKDGNEATVSSAELVAGAHGLVKLTFENELEPFSSYTVTAKNITAGSDKEGAIASTLKLGNSKPVAFSTAGAAAIEYANDGTVFYNDYASSVASTESELGQIATVAEFKTATLAGATGAASTDVINDNYYSRGIYEVGEEDGNKYISVTHNDVADAVWRTAVKAANISSYDTVAFEYRVRPHLELEGVRPVFESRNNNYYGIPMPILFDGKITFGGYSDDKIVGRYHDGEWITLTTVYHRGYVTVEGDANNYVKAEIYADGELIFDNLVKVEASTDLDCFIEGATKNAMVTLRVRDYYGEEVTGGKVDMDYMKVYAPGKTFNGKLTEAENVSTEKIGMVFNSIPSYKDIASKITVIDEAGVKVSDVVYADFSGENNIGIDYDAKAELVFATELEGNKSYILKVEGLADIDGNEMTQYYPFTTGVSDIFSDGIIIETREADGKIYATASVKVLNNNLSETALTVTIASYTVENGVETMVNIAEKEVTLIVSEDGQSFVSDEIEVTGANLVRGFLNKGIKAFVPCGEAPITAQ